MIGKTWPSEIEEYRDEKTGRRVKKLTRTGNNLHFYFTENSFTTGKNEIIFLSDRASDSDRAPHEDPLYNVFRMNLDSGECVQLTEEALPFRFATKTPDSRIVAYFVGRELKRLETASGEIGTIYEEKGDFYLGSPSISCDRRRVGFYRNENVGVARGPNYSGFKDRYYRIKDGRITVAAMDGSGWYDAHRDTCWLQHFQFSPDDPALGLFCHEGPWNLVTQRMWLLDFCAREVRPCFRQGEQDTVGHEFWTQDGFIFFDDRGPGHDGTITSDRKQAVTEEVPIRDRGDFVPFVGLIDRRGKLIRRIEMPFYCNHYHANPDNTLLVGDDVDEIVRVEIAGDQARLEPLCLHGSSWYTAETHPHPTWSWDGLRILFASDRGGKINLYLLEL